MCIVYRLCATDKIELKPNGQIAPMGVFRWLLVCCVYVRVFNVDCVLFCRQKKIEFCLPRKLRHGHGTHFVLSRLSEDRPLGHFWLVCSIPVASSGLSSTLPTANDSSVAPRFWTGSFTAVGVHTTPTRSLGSTTSVLLRLLADVERCWW